MATLTPIESLSLQERVYRELRRLLVTGQFEPGQVLTIRSLATSLGTSVMPVREAIQRLAANQALKVEANKSVRVPVMTKSQFLELSDIRKALQALAAEMAAKHATESGIASLEEKIFEAATAKATPDVASLLSLNYALHEGICRCARSTYLLSLVEGIWLKLGPTYGRSLAKRILSNEAGSLDTGIGEFHKETVKEIRAHDPNGARRAAENGVAAATEVILKYADFPGGNDVQPSAA